MSMIVWRRSSRLSLCALSKLSSSRLRSAFIAVITNCPGQNGMIDQPQHLGLVVRHQDAR